MFPLRSVINNRNIASRTELSVKDFKSYPDEYPFRDPTCLTRSPDTLRKENDLILSATLQQADVKHSSRKGAKPALASKPISAAKDCIDIPMSGMPELSLADAFVTHKFPVTLTVHYNPAGMPTPKGDMIVIAVKAQKQTREKVAPRIDVGS